VGAGAAGEDFARVRHLADTAEMARIRIDEGEDLLEQFGIGDDSATAEIDEPLVEA
jgi:hypothetical protein